MNNLTIIGAGPAGLTAAIYALRAGLEVTICESNMYGGQTSVINTVENYPGFESISGINLAESMYNQVLKLGGKFIFSRVVRVDLEGTDKKVYLKDGTELISKAVVVANGLKQRLLNCKGEKEFIGRGVSYCATCDGSFFKNKDVAIVGGGNTALEDALYLSNICNKVYMIVRKDHFRGEKFLTESISKKSNIIVKFETQVDEIKGDTAVRNVVLKQRGEISEVLDIEGVFIAIGYEPECEMYRGQINMDKNGYFLSNENCETNLRGVYVAGDCRVKSLRQIVTAVSDGAICGNKSAEYVFSSEL